MKEDWYRKAFGPSTPKTYETSLFNLITMEFGYIGGPDVIKLFVEKIVELNIVKCITFLTYNIPYIFLWQDRNLLKFCDI